SGRHRDLNSFPTRRSSDLMAGKTGTAKKYKEGKYIGSFVGIVPASPNVKPRAVILVAVDEPQGEAYYGADVAAPAVRNLAQKLRSEEHTSELQSRGHLVCR